MRPLNGASAVGFVLQSKYRAKAAWIGPITAGSPDLATSCREVEIYRISFCSGMLRNICTQFMTWISLDYVSSLCLRNAIVLFVPTMEHRGLSPYMSLLALIYLMFRRSTKSPSAKQLH